MNDRSPDPLADHFDRLVALPREARPRALDALGLPTDQRADLEALLAADDTADTRLDRSLSGAARRLRELAEAPPTDGTRLGPWRVLRELGSGGMGTVLLAERADGAVEQQVAIKVMRGFPTDEGRRRLRQERQVLAQLDHPHIARLIDAGETGAGQPYFVMEYVEGLPVTAHAARAGLDREARIALLDRIAEAVAHAHQRLVVHRDLKPSNVLVRADGTPKLLDFGVAKLIELGDSGAATSTRVWTPGYASPEQKAGQAVTTATDLFALGVLGRELLSGRRPDGAPYEPTLSAVAIDADLAGVLNKATADDPGERYPTVEALRDDLARWRDGRPVRAARDTALYRARKFVGRHRGSVSLVLLVLVALGAFVWRLGIERDRAIEAETLAEQRRLAAEQAADTAQGALDFFAGVLEEVAPERTASRTITIDDWLDRAGARLARERPAGSDEGALLGGYLGALHGSLGDPAKAITRLEPALAQLKTRGLDGGALYAGLASNLAGQLMAAGRTHDAAAWSREAARAWRARADAGDTRAPLLAAMAEGYAHYVLGESEPAAAAYRAALALPSDAPAEPRLRDLRSEAAYMLGGALNGLGRSAEALAALDDALAEREAGGGGASLVAARLHRTRSEALSALGRGAEALPAVERAIEIASAIFGPRGALHANLMNQRGVVLNDLGRYREARDAYTEALRAKREATGADDPVLRLNLANTCDSVGDNDCARREIERLLADPAARGAFLPQQQRQMRQMLGRALSQGGDHAAARRVLEAALAEVLAADGAASPNGAATLITLAHNEQRDGRWAAALDYARRAREAYAAIVPAGHFAFSIIDRIEGFVALGEGRLDDAARRIEAYHDATLASDGADSLWAALAGLHLAILRHAQGRGDDARDLLRRHLPRVRETLLPTHPDRAAAESLATRLGLDR